MLTRSGLSRRRLLGRASSAMLYYPLLRVLDASDAQAAANLNKRVIFVHFGAGTYKEIFWPAEAPTLGTLPFVTAPLEPYKSEMIMFYGLNTVGGTNHGASQYQVLGGWGAGTIGPSDSTTTKNMTPKPYSIDQMIADKLNTPLLNLGVFSNHAQADHVKTVSFDKNGKDALAEDNPTAAFNRLFGSFEVPTGGTSTQDEAALKIASGKKRLMDYLKNDMKALKAGLGSVDREAFETHIEALDKITIELSKGINGSGEGLASCNPKSIPSNQLSTESKWFHNENNGPRVYTLQRMIMAQAMACNLTRVGVWQMGVSQLNAQLLTEGVGRKSEDHHLLAHAIEGTGKYKQEFAEVQRGQMNEIALLTKSLKEMKIGDHTVFDETLIFVSTDLGAPADWHGGDNIATFMLGNLGGTLKGNRYIKPSKRPYNHALITAAHLLDLKDINQVGNTVNVGPLPEVLV